MEGKPDAHDERVGDGLTAMRLTATSYATDHIHLYEFRPVSGAPVPPFTAGAHVDLHLPNGLARQYSIASPQDRRDSYVLGVKREAASRGGSRFMHDDLRVGAILEVGGPRNNFPLVETANHSVLIAGGIGITPIVSMIARLGALRRPWQLFYAVRRRNEAAVLKMLPSAGDSVLLHVDEEEGDVLDVARLVETAPEVAHLYCCGPAAMLEAFKAAAASRPPSHVHLEYFTPLSRQRPRAPSSWSWRGRSGGYPSGSVRQSSRRCVPRACRWRCHVSRASVEHARRAWSPASPTTATCSCRRRKRQATK